MAEDERELRREQSIEQLAMKLFAALADHLTGRDFHDVLDEITKKGFPGGEAEREVWTTVSEELLRELRPALARLYPQLFKHQLTGKPAKGEATHE